MKRGRDGLTRLDPRKTYPVRIEERCRVNGRVVERGKRVVVRGTQATRMVINGDAALD